MDGPEFGLKGQVYEDPKEVREFYHTPLEKDLKIEAPRVRNSVTDPRRKYFHAALAQKLIDAGVHVVENSDGTKLKITPTYPPDAGQSERDFLDRYWFEVIMRDLAELEGLLSVGKPILPKKLEY